MDGAARGNPGPAGIGVVITDAEGTVVKEVGEPLGRTTNNVAEYTAMIRALEEARSLGCSLIHVYTGDPSNTALSAGSHAARAV